MGMEKNNCVLTNSFLAFQARRQPLSTKIVIRSIKKDTKSRICAEDFFSWDVRSFLSAKKRKKRNRF
jgi:hypothetical protein